MSSTTSLTEAEIMALPSKNLEDVLPTDKEIGETEVRSGIATGDDENDYVWWHTAYERPETGEKFKVYDWDGATKGAKE